MNRSIINFLGCLFALSLSACAMTNEVHFNKNYSGTYAINVDFGDMLDMMNSLDPSGKDEGGIGDLEDTVNKSEREAMQAKINQFSGISNAFFDVVDKSRIEFRFDFDNLESLNSAFGQILDAIAEERPGMDGIGSFGTPRFIKNGKVIVHTVEFPTNQMSEDMFDGVAGDGSMDMMKGMMGMMDYTVELSFDRKIRSVETDGVDLIGQEKHVVKTRVDLAKLVNGGAYKIVVKTK